MNRQVKEQNELMQKLRQEKAAAKLELSATENTMSDHDLWEMVKDVGSMEEFQHTGYSSSPNKVPNDHEQTDSSQISETEDDSPHVPNISRSTIERESDIHELRRAALEADDLW